MDIIDSFSHSNTTNSTQTVTCLPCQVAQHVFSIETVYAWRLRKKTALTVENALPSVEQDVAFRIDDRQFVVALTHDIVEIL